jgi:hypothetical protein
VQRARSCVAAAMASAFAFQSMITSLRAGVLSSAAPQTVTNTVANLIADTDRMRDALRWLASSAGEPCERDIFSVCLPARLAASDGQRKV